MAQFNVLSTHAFPDVLPDVAQEGYTPASLSLLSGNIVELYPTTTQPPQINIVPYGCRTSDGPRRYNEAENCTTACADPKHIFANSRQLWNCATLAAVARLVEDGGDDALTIDETSLRYTNSSYGLGYRERAGQTFGFNASVTFSALAKCAQAGCQGVGGVSCSTELREQIDGITSSGAGAVQNLRDTLASYCDSSIVASDDDDSGPGVIISYIIQTLLALLIFISVKVTTSWIQLTTWPFFSKRSTSLPTEKQTLPQAATEGSAAGGVQSAVARSWSATALISAAVEFHETQLYFVIAIQVASLLMSNSLPEVQRGVSSYVAALSNVDRLTYLAYNAWLPSLLVELLLRRAFNRHGRGGPSRPSPHSWYTLVLVTVAWGLGCAILAGGQTVDYDALEAQFKNSQAFDACGGNPSLAVYCGLDKFSGMTLVFEPLKYAVGIGYPAIPALWVQQIAWAIACRGRTDEAIRQAGFYGIGIAGRIAGRKPTPARQMARSVWIGTLEVVWAIIQGGTLVFTCFYLKGLFDAIQRTNLDASRWSFGQTVSVAVWAPFVARWIYLQLFGLVKGFKVRLPREYEVVHKEKEAVLQDGEDSPFAEPALMESRRSVDWPMR